MALDVMRNPREHGIVQFGRIIADAGIQSQAIVVTQGVMIWLG